MLYNRWLYIQEHISYKDFIKDIKKPISKSNENVEKDLDKLRSKDFKFKVKKEVI